MGYSVKSDEEIYYNFDSLTDEGLLNEISKRGLIPQRAKIIINNLLSEIVTKTDIPEEDYIPWLKSEIGITAKELEELQQDNCIPMPIE